MQRILFFLLISILAITSCRKNTEEVTKTENPYVPPIIENWEQAIAPVTGDLTGMIVDENGQAVANASITLGNHITSTTQFGTFQFKNVELNARGSLVRVEKAGYFPGSRRVFAVDGTENRVKVELIQKTFDYSIDAEQGGEIVMNGGAKLSFSPNSIKTEEGLPYTGTVRIAAKWLNPENLNTFDQMPGNLQGVNQLAEEVALTTAGMMAVELESPDGQALNIREGHTAEIAMPVPSSLSANAPPSVPTWSYSEEHGVWVEEGSASLQGDFYVGKVSHFSFWNWDYYGPLVSFTLTLLNEEGTGIEGYEVLIKDPATGTCGYGYTSTDGILSGVIPEGIELSLEVYGLCNEVIHQELIGPFNEDADITITVTEIYPIAITGELVDCDNNPVGNGLVIVEFDGYYPLYHYTDGTPFQVNFFECQSISEATIQVVDLGNALQNDPITINAPFDENTDLGPITVCDNAIEHYIQVTVDGTEELYFPVGGYYTLLDTVGGVFQYGTIIRFEGGNDIKNVFFLFPGDDVGDYGASSGNPATFNELVEENHNWYFNSNSGVLETFEVSAYGEIGEPIIGSFSGNLVNQSTGLEVPVSGSFNVIRTQ
ncbi:MAG: hypothetical protein MI974_05660 [Chitinophagales bacterium]|nr:hypothetical protein [Chitinophagales bacterium]